jgi:hypothetical protein
MKFKCIHCHIEWGDGDPDLEGFSHGLCKKCLKLALSETYRKRQRTEGYQDCFATKNECDQYHCVYRKVCLEEKG